MRAFRFTTTTVAATIAIALLSPVAWGQARVEASWGELAELNGRMVSTVLADGIFLTGKIVAVTDEGLRFQVKKTSDRNAYPRGEQMIPRPQVSALSYTKMGGVLWRPVGAAIGAAGGSLATLPFWVTASGEGGLEGRNAGITVGGIGGMAAVGYLLGREDDKKTVTVVVRQQ